MVKAPYRFTMRIDGREIATTIFSKQNKQVAGLVQKNITPHLAVILVGTDEASHTYVRQKKLKGEKIGIHVSIHEYKDSVTGEELLAKIKELNNDSSVHGIIIQQPLPKHIDHHRLVEATDPQKDVDGFHTKSKFTPPIAEAVIEILKRIHNFVILNEVKDLNIKDSSLEAQNDNFFRWLKTKKITVIGKGETGGAPIKQKLQSLGVRPLNIDSKTDNPEDIMKQSAIIISCVGKPDIVTKHTIKKGVILLSIGMFRGKDGKLHGDYEEDDIKDTARYYTPVPGGVGPVNVAMLLQNVIDAAKG